MTVLETINDLRETIKKECYTEADYEGYVENCLLIAPEGGADYYGITLNQFKYACKRALLSA